MLTDEFVVVKESLLANGILLHFLICLVEAGGIIDKLELVGTDGSDGRY